MQPMHFHSPGHAPGRTVPDMMSEQAERHPNSRWPEVIAVMLSIFAVAISGYALIEARQQHRDERASELIDAVYEDWDEMAFADYWESSHLTEVPATYEQHRNVLRAYTSGLSEREKYRIHVLERINAGRILANFEKHLNQWRIAVESGDELRSGMLQVELDFYTQEQLRNPRMLWLMAEEGGGLVTWLDPLNVPYYREKVLNDPGRPLTHAPDPDGILPGFDPLRPPGE
jgi:hypothetical protein